MDLEKFSSFWNVVTSIGAVLIPLALYYIKTEIKDSSNEIGKKLDLHVQKFEDHIKSDEEFQERNNKTLDKISNKLNII